MHSTLTCTQAKELQEAEKRRRTMEKLRREEMTRRRGKEASARSAREHALKRREEARLKSIKRVGGGFTVKFKKS